jgi:hypothetical protein
MGVTPLSISTLVSCFVPMIRLAMSEYMPGCGTFTRWLDQVEGDGGPRPSEESEHGWLSRIDLMTRELLATLGVISRRSSEDHEVAYYLWEGALLPSASCIEGSGFFFGSPLLEPLDKNRHMRD